jgi:imidazolonepropionase-like amidohydrolase
LQVGVGGFWLACSIARFTRGQAGQPSGPPDTILVNGAVLTVDPRDSVAEAVAITGGRISAVGTTAQVKALAGPATQVVDLAGRAVTPGLIDSHVHFSEADKRSVDPAT